MFNTQTALAAFAAEDILGQELSTFVLFAFPLVSLYLLAFHLPDVFVFLLGPLQVRYVRANEKSAEHDASCTIECIAILFIQRTQ